MHFDRGTARDADDLPRLLNVNEVAEILGVNVRAMSGASCSRVGIPYLKGRLVRFDAREIERWLRVSCEPHRKRTVSGEWMAQR